MSIPYVPADRLARMRALDERAMPDSATITHSTPGTINPDGSEDPGATTTVTYPCRVAASGGSPQETLIASRLTDTTPFTFIVPDSAAVSEQDTIVYQGASYQVLGVLDPVSYSTSIRIVTKRIS